MNHHKPCRCRRLRAGLFVAAVLVSETGPPADAADPPTATEFHVAVGGNDAWGGASAAPNAGRTDGPFATVTRARDAVRQVIAKGLDRDVRVVVHGGTHYLPGGLKLSHEDSGTAQFKVTYAAAPG